MIPENLNELNKLDEVQMFNYKKTLEDYLRVSDALKDPNVKNKEYLLKMQLRFFTDLDALQYTPEDKLRIYLEGHADMLPPDGAGKDEICGHVLPTEDEVKIGMYPDRSVFYFSPFTCGVYHFYTTDGRFNYVGGSQYIEYALHSHFCRWRSEKESPDKERKRKFRGLAPVKYILDNYPDKLRFRIIERVPYSLLDTAVRNQRSKNKSMWIYDMVSPSTRWSPDKFEAGEYDY